MCGEGEGWGMLKSYMLDGVECDHELGGNGMCVEAAAAAAVVVVVVAPGYLLPALLTSRYREARPGRGLVCFESPEAYKATAWGCCCCCWRAWGW